MTAAAKPAARTPAKTADYLLRRLFMEMQRIRVIERRIADRYSEQEMRCPVHLSIGQEAVAVGVCAHLNRQDRVMSAHRSHGHYLAKGGGVPAMISELYGRVEGCCGGRGGSMHLMDREAGFWGAVPIVGSTLPIALGLALADKRLGGNGKTAAFLGEGATEEGVFTETLNLACVLKVPMLFVCENNGYSVYTPLEPRRSPDFDFGAYVRSHGALFFTGDGNDVEDVWRITKQALEAMQADPGRPCVVEFFTWRYYEHCGPGQDDHLGYREEKEILHWAKRDPLAVAKERLIAEDPSIETEIEAAEKKYIQDIDAVIAAVKAGPKPDPATLERGVFAPPVTPHQAGEQRGPTKEITYAEAVRDGTAEALRKDPRAFIIGLGVPDPKGIFGTTGGLLAEFGPERVLDAPLSENALTGLIIGAALGGLRPILTHQRVDFALLSLEQIVNQAAKWYYMFDGRGGTVPIVIRLVIGRGWGQGPQHAQSLTSWFAHIPGLKVVAPASPADAKGMLVASVEDENPVVFLEHRWLHGMKGPVPPGYHRVPLEKCLVSRKGADLTIVASSHMVIESLRAADFAAAKGAFDMEVVDMRCLNPLDFDTIAESVRKTRKLIVADDDSRHCGMAGEIVARVAEAGLPLDVPPVRVTYPDCASPSSAALAAAFYPTARDIYSAAARLTGKGLDFVKDFPERPCPVDVPNLQFPGPF
jgi:pyruvate/2-oxoglutarate/acetoin dehydrogenase E1 component/TPP-dependent pyruvate/acetoin dehydrogenase alpha subunit